MSDINKNFDKIHIYGTPTGFRWTRRAAGNHRIIGASTEEYNRLPAARANVRRTQKGPFVLQILDDEPIRVH